MPSEVCISCRLPKSAHQCGLCQAPVCKKCVQRLGEHPFPFLAKVPPELSHRTYCPSCHVEKVQPVQSEYERDMARARQVFIFTKAKSAETRLLSRSEKPLRVVDCEDHDETLMRLAFQAVRVGCNAVIDVEVAAKKVRHFGYQTSRWQGVGIPTRVDADRLNRESPPR